MKKTAPPPQQPAPSRLLDTDALATYLGVHPATVKNWRHDGVGPRYMIVGERGIRYRMTDVERWLDEECLATRRGRSGAHRAGSR